MPDWMWPDFMWLAAASGCLIALLAAPLGCMVVWQRMAYFGDTLAHSALLGVAGGLWLHLPPMLGIGGIAVLVAVLLVLCRQRQHLAWDTLLGLLSHSMLALGVVVSSFLPAGSVRLEALLFGDLLAISQQQLWLLALAVPMGLGVLWRIWPPLVLLTLHEELAQAENVPVRRIQLGFVLLLAMTITLAIPLAGMLLITALMIIPAATARLWAQDTRQMVILAAVLGIAATLVGLVMAWFMDMPAGAAIVLAAFGCFVLSLLVPRPNPS